jgi:rubrerythrin
MSSPAIPPESQGELLEIFKAAMQDERRAQRVYTLALGLCQEPSLRAVLQGLIDDEVRHEQILLERYNALLPRGQQGL